MALNNRSPEEEFLAKAGLSKRECHGIAKYLTGSNDISAVPLQGGRSYTVRGGDIVVQFRSEPLDLSVHEKAAKIYGTRYVLPIMCRQVSSFYVYTSPYGGKSCCAKEFRVNVAAQKTALRDIATLFAQACTHPVDHMDVQLNMIEVFLKDCLGLPGVQREIQHLLDNLRIIFPLEC